MIFRLNVVQNPLRIKTFQFFLEQNAAFFVQRRSKILGSLFLDGRVDRETKELVALQSEVMRQRRDRQRTIESEIERNP